MNSDYDMWRAIVEVRAARDTMYAMYDAMMSEPGDSKTRRRARVYRDAWLALDVAVDTCEAVYDEWAE